MNVKLRILSMGVLFFTGHTLMAQRTKQDTIKTKNIDEVVILGYSKTTTKPKDVTASTTISSETVANRPNASFLNSIQGAAPGVTVSSMSGSPGSAKIDVMIRGLSSLNASTDPLYVIDGISYSATEFRNLNTNDIETISILRDAAATSVYGNRGANGVIIISTKTGKFGSAFKVGYSALSGVSVLPQNKYEMADTRQLLTLEKGYGTGLGSTLTDAEIAAYPTNTSWRNVFFHPSFSQQHDLNFTVGGKNVATYTSFGYLYQGGTVPSTDFQRFTVRNNLNGKSDNGRFTYNTQLALGFSRRNQLDQETNDGVAANIVQNPLHGSLLGLPYLKPNQYPTGQSLYDAIGSDFTGGKYIYVLEDILRKGNIPSWYDENTVLANISGNYKITPDWTIGNKAGVDYKAVDRVFARAPWSYLATVVAATSNLQYPGFERLTNTKDFTFNNVLSTTYHKEIGEHTFDVGAYMDYLKAHYYGKTQTQNGLNALTYVPGAGTGYVPIVSGPPVLYAPQVSAAKVTAGTLSYFGTFDYDYSGKYGLSGVVRRDGSYRFVGDKKWGTFWSIAGRWNIDRENFMEGSIFDMLKLRGSYGTQGNQNVVAPSYGTNPLFLGTNLVRDLNTTGTGYNNASSYTVGQIGNTSLQWEEVSQIDAGLDFSIWNRKIEGNFDYYVKTTDKLYNDINLSATTSLYSYNGNNGKMQNKGVEAMLRYNAIKSENFNLSLFANASYNENVIKAILGDMQDNGSTIFKVGAPAYEWYLVPYVGVNQDTGNMQFLDINGNITEAPTQADRRETGKSFLPKWQGGFGVNSDYRGFTFDVLFSFQKDAWKYDNEYSWLMDPTSIGENNLSSALLNAWTPANHSNIPSLTATNTGLDGSSDRYLIDASFLRLKSLTLGYALPKDLIPGKTIKSLKIFVQGENLALWTKWKGFDPEGFELFPLGKYPNPRTISLGTNIEF